MTRCSDYVGLANPTVRDGSWADYLVVSEDVSIGRKPGEVALETAGAAPLAGISALAVLDALELAEGDTVLVIGATGGVGSFFVQLASATGAIVIAPAFPEDHDYLRELGVSEIFDRNADVVEQARNARPDGVDAVLDVVSFSPDVSVLREDGRLASTLGAAGEGAGRANIMASPTTANIERLGRLLAADELHVPIRERYTLERAGEALDSMRTGHTQGKLAIEIG